MHPERSTEISKPLTPTHLNDIDQEESIFRDGVQLAPSEISLLDSTPSKSLSELVVRDTIRNEEESSPCSMDDNVAVFSQDDILLSQEIDKLLQHFNGKELLSSLKESSSTILFRGCKDPSKKLTLCLHSIDYDNESRLLKIPIYPDILLPYHQYQREESFSNTEVYMEKQNASKTKKKK